MSSIAAKIINPIYEGVCCSGSDTCKVSLYTEAGVIDGLWLLVGGVGVAAQLLLSPSWNVVGGGHAVRALRRAWTAQIAA